MHSGFVCFPPIGLLWCIKSPIAGLILILDPAPCTTAMFAYSDPGPASFLLPMMVFAFSVNSLATSLKVRGAGEVVEAGVVAREVDMRFSMNSLKICHSTLSGRPCLEDPVIN